MDNDADGATVVHEIGHLADLWGHTSDPDNIMTDQPGGTGEALRRHRPLLQLPDPGDHLLGEALHLLSFPASDSPPA